MDGEFDQVVANDVTQMSTVHLGKQPVEKGMLIRADGRFHLSVSPITTLP